MLRRFFLQIYFLSWAVNFGVCGSVIVVNYIKQAFGGDGYVYGLDGSDGFTCAYLPLNS